ncbi:MAG: type II toxin-antitoxin system RelE/ParE family toxin [Spirochaetes bacterium]|nr:type II toxin-antitoxin system RelE/ParE family toxin [Spirochaetota bacterium]
MSKYKIFETDQFISDLHSVPKQFRNTIEKKIHQYMYKQIVDNPFYGKNIKKLKGFKPETWRYRIGNYRLFYEIDNSRKIIFIIAIDDR